MTAKLESFRGHEIRLLPGATHPGYSVTCFDEERAFREKHFDPQLGDVVVDAGASYGAYTLSALAAGARVLAFEPESSVMVDLVRNVYENGWGDRCSFFGNGLWDSTTSIKLIDYASHWPSASELGSYHMIALDSLGLKRLDWLKIDVEGAEQNVIRGALHTIERCKPRIIVECHSFIDAGIPDRVRELLSGYELEEVEREPCVMLVGRARA